MRQSLTLDGGYTGENWYAKTLFFFDKFDNTLSEANPWENVAVGNYLAPSTYDDFGLGVRLEGGVDLNSRNKLQGALTFKQEGHRDDKDGINTKDIRENIWSAGVEYSVMPWESISLSAGLGFDYFQPASFWSINDLHESTAAGMVSAQGGIFWYPAENHRFHLTVAKKNHLPTMAVRYSSGGTMIDVNPNPDLKPEEALHYEGGYKGHFSFDLTRMLNPALDLSAALYYSDLTNMLAERIGAGGFIERINADKTAYYGLEMGLSLYLKPYLSAGGTLSLSRYTIKYNEQSLDAVGNYPRTIFNGWIAINPLSGFSARPLSTLSLIPSIEYEDVRYGSTHMINVNAANILPAYFLVHLRLSAEFTAYFSLAAGVENLLDENYALNNGALPMAGRSFYVTVTGKW
jgi:iron complex outermembrane receptor protein